MVSYQDAFIDLSAEQILAIDPDRPELLFKRDAGAIGVTYKALAKKWYPDLNKDPQAEAVFKHLGELHTRANDKLKAGIWHEEGYYNCVLKDGHAFRVRSDVHRDFELGRLHISPTTATYVIPREHEDLFRNAVKRIDGLKFDDDKMRDVYAPILPTTYKVYETEHSLILTVKKRPDDVLLRDLLPHITEHLDRHTAWITSRMHEMARFLDHAGLSHNAMTLDTIFASPSQHTIGLFGGWWYATPIGETLTAVPGEAVEFLPDTGGKPIPASSKTDREMLRAAAREMLGDRDGTRLSTLKPAPPPMLDYLRAPSSGDAQKDLRHWYRDVLTKSFGARRFTELPVTYSDVYQPGGVT